MGNIHSNWKTSMSISPHSRVDEISQMFGGLSVCSLEAVVSRDGKEFIIEVNDSATTLMGESQEEDRKQIADLVAQQMEVGDNFNSEALKAVS